LMVFRSKANHHGLRLMLDFVPNHVGLDHPWAINCPEMFIHSDPKHLRDKLLQQLPAAPNYATGVTPFFRHGRTPTS
jgi:glycosidase